LEENEPKIEKPKEKKGGLEIEQIMLLAKKPSP